MFLNIVNWGYNMNFCCKDLKYFLEDKKHIFKYNKKFREYYLNDTKYSQYSIITLSYCPFCGNTLPTNLRNEFFDALEREYGLEVSLGDLQDSSLIPEEFKTDEWWKKRGL